MTPDEAVAELSTLDVKHAGDVEMIHDEVDAMLLAMVPEKVAQAYDRLEQRVGGFWYA